MNRLFSTKCIINCNVSHKFREIDPFAKCTFAYLILTVKPFSDGRFINSTSKTSFWVSWNRYSSVERTLEINFTTRTSERLWTLDITSVRIRYYTPQTQFVMYDTLSISFCPDELLRRNIVLCRPNRYIEADVQFSGLDSTVSERASRRILIARGT